MKRLSLESKVQNYPQATVGNSASTVSGPVNNIPPGLQLHSALSIMTQMV